MGETNTPNLETTWTKILTALGELETLRIETTVSALAFVVKDGATVAVRVDGRNRVGFNTPSGRQEFYSPTLAAFGWEDQAIPGYIRSHVHPERIDRNKGEFVLQGEAAHRHDVVGLLAEDRTVPVGPADEQVRREGVPEHMRGERAAYSRSCAVHLQDLPESHPGQPVCAAPIEEDPRRLAAVRQERPAVAQILADPARGFLPERDDALLAAFALTLEMVEIDPDLSWKKNAIHPRLRGA